jgi:hypothetical protein
LLVKDLAHTMRAVCGGCQELNFTQTPLLIAIPGKQAAGQENGRNERGGCRQGYATALSPYPAAEAFHVANRSGVDRLISEMPSQVIRQLGCRGVASVWLFFEAFEADGFEVLRQSRIEQARRNRFLLDDLSERIEGSGRLKGRAAG